MMPSLLFGFAGGICGLGKKAKEGGEGSPLPRIRPDGG